jgi:hypothetical protein
MIEREIKFGRLPTTTVALFESNIGTVCQQVLKVVPSSATAEARAFTLEQILQTVFRDWQENDNATPLGSTDAADLASFIQAAVSTSRADFSPEGLAIYQSTLNALLTDWLHNWNGTQRPPLAKLGENLRNLISSKRGPGISRKADAATVPGRVSEQTRDLFQQVSTVIRGPVLNALPLSASNDMRVTTLKLVLDTVLLDWCNNGNTSGLQDSDAEDICNFVRAAVWLVSKCGDDARIIYPVILKSLLEDWLHNWNANGVTGPPRR